MVYRFHLCSSAERRCPVDQRSASPVSVLDQETLNTVSCGSGSKIIQFKRKAAGYTTVNDSIPRHGTTEEEMEKVSCVFRKSRELERENCSEADNGGGMVIRGSRREEVKREVFITCSVSFSNCKLQNKIRFVNVYFQVLCGQPPCPAGRMKLPPRIYHITQGPTPKYIRYPTPLF